MDYLPIANVVLNACVLIGGYLLKTIFDRLKADMCNIQHAAQQLDNRVRSVEITAVTRQELKEALNGLLQEIYRMSDKLDRQNEKLDKLHN